MKPIRIMVISNIEWNNQNAMGNTMSNWLEGIDDLSISNIYRRDSRPNNNVCKSYLSISTTSILKNFFRKESIGEIHRGNFSVLESNKASEAEHGLINLIHSMGNKTIYVADELIFNTKLWRNKRFCRFLDEEKPEIIFSFLTGSPQYLLIRNEIKKIIPECKEIYFIADDVYGNETQKGRRVIEQLIYDADLLYGASELLCEEYYKLFRKKIKPLYKGCRFPDEVLYLDNQRKEQVIEISYAGNLHYGRDDALLFLSNTIRQYNSNRENKKKYHLGIYSSMPLKMGYASSLNDGVNSTFFGAKPYDEIQRILHESDIVLHVESFEDNWINVVRYSYSTKIIDCLESGSVLLAIGPGEIASIREASIIPGVVTITKQEDVLKTLASLANEENLKNRALLTRQYARQHFQIEAVQKQLVTDFAEIRGASE